MKNKKIWKRNFWRVFFWMYANIDYDEMVKYFNKENGIYMRKIIMCMCVVMLMGCSIGETTIGTLGIEAAQQACEPHNGLRRLTPLDIDRPNNLRFNESSSVTCNDGTRFNVYPNNYGGSR